MTAASGSHRPGSLPSGLPGPVARLGVLGGTFDPVHAAHLRIATTARAVLHLDTVLFLPAGDPWRKRDRAVTAAAHRLAMVEAALAEAALAEAAHAGPAVAEGAGAPAPGEAPFPPMALAVSDLEIRRRGPTYTAETLRALWAEGHGAIWFLLGADALLDLPHWHDPPAILALARLGVVTRPGVRLPARDLDRLLPGLAAVVDWVEMPPLDVSATDLRARLTRGLPVDDVVPAAVRAYIAAHGIYRQPK